MSRPKYPDQRKYPDFWKKAFSSSHLCNGRQPCEKPNIADVFFTNGVHGCPESPVSYINISCKEPPKRSFRGENAANLIRLLCEDGPHIKVPVPWILSYVKKWHGFQSTAAARILL
jgi:hypothetical protein